MWVEKAADEQFMTYRCSNTTLRVFDSKNTVRRIPYVLRLPYMETMLHRRAAEGKDVPVWWQGDVIEDEQTTV